MKLLLSLIALINGGYMLADGIYVLLKGKYIGPEKPGPWANLFYKFHIDVFKLGPVFICFGMLWMACLAGLWLHQSWAYTLWVAVAALTLWYLPVGTLLSVAALVILLAARQKTGL